MHIIIVGASHGGYAAVNGVMAHYPDATIGWYDQGSISVAAAWSHEEDASQRRTLAAKGVTLFDGTQVTALHTEAHQIETKVIATGKTETVHYDKLILSPGSTTRQLPIPGIELDNIQTIPNRQALTTLRQKLSQQPDMTNITIVGAGYIGVSMAESFAKMGKQVALMDISDRILARYLAPEFTTELEDALQDHGVNLVLGEATKAFIGNHDHQVTAVETDTATYPADLVILAIGVQPDTAWLKDQLTLLPNGMIETDDYMQTSAPDVFAIGDATMSRSTLTGARQPIALSGNARHEARIAVANLLTPTIPFDGIQGTSALRLFDYTFAATGLNQTSAEQAGIPVATIAIKQPHLLSNTPAAQQATDWFNLFYNPETGAVLGAQLMSTADLTATINVISVAIQAHFTVQQLAEADLFFQPEFNTPDHIVTTAAQKAVDML